MEQNADVLSDLKCEFSSKRFENHYNNKYMLTSCSTNIFDKDDDLFLRIYLEENIKYLNYKNEYGKDVINCNI